MALLIRGGTVVNADTASRADVLVDGETVVAVGTNLTAPAGATVVDAGGAYVMPGGIDPHTHMELLFMGQVSADDFEWGTKAGLAGGTTMIVDHCIPAPGASMVEAVKAWHEKAAKAAGDFSYHVAVTGWTDRTAEEMGTVVNEMGVNTFKHFMAYKGALMVDDDIMFKSFSRCAQLGATALVHAENGDLVLQLQNHYMGQGKSGPEFHAYSRPPEVEGEATNRAIMIADMAGCPVYIVHTSCIQAHEAIARARAQGKRVFGEPLIQHLVLDETDYLNREWEHSAQRVMSPPFRPKSHQESLWNGLISGSLQIVATDHCAFTTAQKRTGLTDFRLIPNGTGGVEDRMAVLWDRGVNTGRLTPSEFVAVTSANVAKVLNCYPQKGVIAPGADADIVIWDPAATKTISAKSQISRIDYNVFEGIDCKGLPSKVFLRGRLAAENGKLIADKGWGRFVKRPPLPPFAKALATWKELMAPKAVAREAVTP